LVHKQIGEIVMRVIVLLVLFAIAALGLPRAAAQPATVVIRQADLPFRIHAPGNYTLGEDLHAPFGSPAILLAASDVTLDLGGRTIHGPAGAADHFAAAIEGETDTATDRICLRNGTLRAFPSGAIALPKAAHLLIEGLEIVDVGGIAIDVGDEAIIRNNRLRRIRVEDPDYSGAVIGIRAEFNSLVENNTLQGLHHGGIGHLDAIRVGRGCYVVGNRIESMSTAASGSGDVMGIACVTAAADIRNNTIRNLQHLRPSGMAIGIRVGSGSVEDNRVSGVQSANLAIGIQGIAAVFIVGNFVEEIQAIAGGPDAYGIWAAGTGGRIAGNTIRQVDCGSDESRNREIGLRANSAFEITRNSVSLAHHRLHAHQAGIEISGQQNVLVENVIRVGTSTRSAGLAILLRSLSTLNTVGGNEILGEVRDEGAGNTVPLTVEGIPAI
jgi:hypothetical protein